MIDVVVPSVGESITEVTLSKYIVREGGYVKKDDPIFELESDKASLEVTAPLSGIVRYVAKEGAVLKVGAKVCGLEKADKAPVSETSLEHAGTPQSSPFMGELGVSEISRKAPLHVQESPPINRGEIQIKKEPIISEGGIRSSPEHFLDSLTKEEPEILVSEHAGTPQSSPLQVQEFPRIYRGEIQSDQKREPLSKLRKAIAKRLVQVKNETAMLTTFNEVDLFEIVSIRNREKDEFLKKYGVKLTYLPFFIKAAISALKEFPAVNAFIDGDDIVYNKHQHIGIAVSTDSGLVVPVIKNVDKLSFVEMTKAINEFAIKARERKLSISDMSGGTFTITNGGVFGSMLSTPILNPPQSAILGMHNIVDRPVALNGSVVIRPIMYLALSYDHRIIDGKESVSFLVQMKEMLENPSKFLFS